MVYTGHIYVYIHIDILINEALFGRTSILGIISTSFNSDYVISRDLTSSNTIFANNDKHTLLLTDDINVIFIIVIRFFIPPM